MSHGETINFLLWAQPHGAVILSGFFRAVVPVLWLGAVEAIDLRLTVHEYVNLPQSPVLLTISSAPMAPVIPNSKTVCSAIVPRCFVQRPLQGVSWRAGDDELGGDGLELLMKDGECGEEVVVDGEKIEFSHFSGAFCDFFCKFVVGLGDL
ncbi:hypothetical protein B0H14DRAFT_3141860 [Mycena olivaceomarginata]|nr:hypothetical protein B0H14DRAFT_3141860 [Mycena olivaceomarginata]